MIRINLLPAELQRAASTPRTVFYSVLSGVAAVALGAIGIMWLWIAQGTMEAKAETQTALVSVLEERAHEVDRIQSDIDYYRQREESIIQIKTRRILWAPKLDQMLMLIPEDIWITSLLVTVLDDGEYRWDPNSRQSGGRVVLDCVALGNDPQVFTRFRKALSEDQRFYADLVDVSSMPDSFFGDFLGFTPLSWEKIESTDEEPEHFRSSIGIDLKPLQDPPVVETPKNSSEAK
ncbi:MAG: hypothetical protein VYD70_00910 [Planctomycetota bacterium]|nr:hypothetical protein [Planctomycetota bacterium]